MYVLLQQPDQSQVVDPSQDFEEEDESEEDNHPEVDVIDQEEEDDEAMIDFMVNDDVANQEHEPVPTSHAYDPPFNIENLNLGEDEPASDIFHNPYMQTEGALKVGNKFRTKEECLRAIKKYHMEILADFTVDKNNSGRYVILCRQKPIFPFRLTASYRKRSDSWEIGSIDPLHTCITTVPTQDHQKLSSQLICQEILPLISKDPSLKVSTIISHITTRFNYTPSYRKAWIGRTKAVELVYGNWEESYKELPRFLVALKYYAPGTVIILETLSAFTPDRTRVSGNGIFHRLFWAFEPCIKGFAFCKPIIQIDGTWLYGKYKGTLLMAVAQDGNNNVFLIAFALVEGETGGAWNFFLKNLRLHVAPNPTFV